MFDVEETWTRKRFDASDFFRRALVILHFPGLFVIRSMEMTVDPGDVTVIVV